MSVEKRPHLGSRSLSRAEREDCFRAALGSVRSARLRLRRLQEGRISYKHWAEPCYPRLADALPWALAERIGAVTEPVKRICRNGISLSSRHEV